ncbi:MAG: Gfo/Idh/MocA family oxidoreductase [Armatimonadota bacterium]
MLRIGIVGSENSHTAAFAKILNVRKTLAGARVVALWGEEPEHTRKVAERCLIPEIVQSPEEMIGKIDAAIVDHRHAKYHVPASTPLVEAGIHVFVDKPFSYTVEEGRELLRLARKKKVIVTSYSCVRYAHGFQRVIEARKRLEPILAADFSGPCNIESEHGGVFFYGVHQCEMMVGALGPGAESVTFHRGTGNSHLATVMYADGGPCVTLHLMQGYQGGFGWGFYGEKGSLHGRLDYRGLYLRGLEAYLRMIKTGKNDLTPEEMLTPVAVLSAIDRSMASGRSEPVESVTI